MSSLSRNSGGGRPRLDVHRLKTNVYFSPEELFVVDETATRTGRSRSALLRELALGHKVVAPPSLFDRDGLRQMARLGGLLNQLLKKIHFGEVDRELEEDLHFALRAIGEVHRQLVGRDR